MERQYLICIGPIKNRNAGRPPLGHYHLYVYSSGGEIFICGVKGRQLSVKTVPLTSESACSSWWVFGQGGGGARRLVLLRVDSADICSDIMTQLEFFPVQYFHCQDPTIHLHASMPTHLSSKMTGAEAAGDTL